MVTYFSHPSYYHKLERQKRLHKRVEKRNRRAMETLGTSTLMALGPDVVEKAVNEEREREPSQIQTSPYHHQQEQQHSLYDESAKVQTEEKPQTQTLSPFWSAEQKAKRLARIRQAVMKEVGYEYYVLGSVE
jgi:hypothetical protein